MPAINSCQRCGEPLLRKGRRDKLKGGPHRRYCSSRCRTAAHRLNRLPRETEADAIEPNWPTCPTENIEEKGAVALQISRTEAQSHIDRRWVGNAPAAPPCNATPAKSSARIVGPRSVIHAEIIAGREWQEVVSADGVKSYVSRLGKRALVVPSRRESTCG